MSYYWRLDLSVGMSKPLHVYCFQGIIPTYNDLVYNSRVFEMGLDNLLFQRMTTFHAQNYVANIKFYVLKQRTNWPLIMPSKTQLLKWEGLLGSFFSSYHDILLKFLILLWSPHFGRFWWSRILRAMVLIVFDWCDSVQRCGVSSFTDKPMRLLFFLFDFNALRRQKGH